MLLIGKFSLHRLSKIISALNVDVIISNSFANVYGAVIAQKCCIPHIWHVREFMELDHKITHYNNQKIRSMCEKSYAIFISEVIEKYYLKKYKFIDYKTIYNQIQLKNNFKLEAKFKSEIINIIMVGALTIGKGQLEAIRAVELVAESGKKVNLDIYGEGPFNHELKKYIQNKQLDYVHLKGVSNNITELRKQYDVALMCSDSEALGRVTVEAMYYGNLIIGANCGCTPYIISDGITGYLYEKGDYEDLAQKILMLYGNPVRNNEIIMNAREYAILNFSKSIKPKIEQFICSIISPET
jgi:glycosyltransferase involved in cell wall biosynthesis